MGQDKTYDMQTDSASLLFQLFFFFFCLKSHVIWRDNKSKYTTGIWAETWNLCRALDLWMKGRIVKSDFWMPMNSLRLFRLFLLCECIHPWLFGWNIKPNPNVNRLRCWHIRISFCLVSWLTKLSFLSCCVMNFMIVYVPFEHDMLMF